MRRGELKSLRRKHVDLTHRLITVEAIHTKTHHLRTIPMTHTLVELLTPLAGPLEAFVFGGRGFEYGFSMAVRTLGLARFRFHDLRHTFASRPIMAGVDPMTAKDLLGHRSIQTTMVYTHLSPEHLRTAVEKLDQGSDGSRRDGPGRSAIDPADAQAILQALKQLGLVADRR
jgi:integrase